MVKGISRQVIVVEPAGQEIFEQAIFLLKDSAPEISEDQLLRRRKRLFQPPGGKNRCRCTSTARCGRQGARWLLALSGC